MDRGEIPHQETPRHRHTTLTARTLSAFLWAFTGTGFQAVLRVVVVATLSRLLLPADFGVVGAALTVVALADLFTQVGVAPSIVQAPTLTPANIRTAFSVTVLMGIVVGLLMLVLAPLVAAAFRMPQLAAVVRAFCVIFVVRGFAAIAQAILQREMRFKEIAVNAVLSYFFGYAVCSISLALAGFGIWALIAGLILQNVISSVGLLRLARHSMLPLFDIPSLKHLAVFGTGMTLARVGNYLAVNADYFIVGRWLGAEALGFYSRAYVILMQPAQLFGSAADNVMFPAMASIQHDEDRLASAYHRALALIALVTLPLSGAIIPLAPEIVFILLGERWGSVVFPLQILIATLFIRTAYKITGSLLRSRGKVYRHAAWQWSYAFLVALGAWFGQPHGIAGVAVGVSLAIIINFWIGILIARAQIAISFRKILAPLARYALLMVVFYLSVSAMKQALLPMGLHAAVTLIAGAGLCLIIAMALWFFVPRLFGEEGDWLRDQIASRLASIGR